MRLVKWMAKAGLRPDTLAPKIGVTPTAVYRYLDGSRIPDPPIMAKIREVSGGRVTADDFYRFSPRVAT